MINDDDDSPPELRQTDSQSWNMNNKSVKYQ